jgi:hypothetical protein
MLVDLLQSELRRDVDDAAARLAPARVGDGTP